MNDRLYERQSTRLRHMIDRQLASLVRRKEPKDLVDACRYVLLAGGKRVRSTLVLLSCNAVGGRMADALGAAAAVEALHNFTLVHDDIMDNAGSRRGRPTVHMKWDVNNALLTGDVLLGLGYRSLENTKSGNLRRLVRLYTHGFLEVCEGQALDLAFERRGVVTVKEYIGMIDKKTALMISMAAELGAIIGGGSRREIAALRTFGHYLGRAFQVQDDLLDIVADERRFGKTIGGDIVEGKKTYLLITAYDRAGRGDRAVLRRVMTNNGRNSRRTVRTVAALYRKYGVLESARELVGHNTRRAASSLDVLPRSDATEMLRRFSHALLNRIS